MDRHDGDGHSNGPGGQPAVPTASVSRRPTAPPGIPIRMLESTHYPGVNQGRHGAGVRTTAFGPNNAGMIDHADDTGVGAVNATFHLHHGSGCPARAARAPRPPHRAFHPGRWPGTPSRARQCVLGDSRGLDGLPRPRPAA